MRDKAKELGEKLRGLREAKGLSREQVEARSRELYPNAADPRARRMWIGTAYLDEAEGGKFIPPTHKLRVLAEIYGQPLEPVLELAGRRRGAAAEELAVKAAREAEELPARQMSTEFQKPPQEDTLSVGVSAPTRLARRRRPSRRDKADRRERKHFHLAAVIALATLVYLNSLSGQFVFGDLVAVVDNPAVRDITNAALVFGFAGGRPFESPVTEVSYMVDYALGSERPLVYHVGSIVYHAAAAVCVYLAVDLLLHSSVAALFASALFAVHPVNTEAVAHIAGRRELLLGLLYLAGFYAHLRYQATHKRWHRIASFAAFALALFTSPLALSFPVMVLWAEFVRGLRLRGETRYAPLGQECARALRDLVAHRRWIYVSLAVLALLAGGYQLYVPGGWLARGLHGGNVLSHIWTLSRILVHYLRLLAYPVGLSADYSFNAFPASTALPGWSALAALAIVAALCYGGIRALRRHKYYSFSVVWILVLLILAAQWTPRREVVVERLLYLPCFGFCLAVGFLLSQGMQTVRHSRLMYSLFAILLAWYGITTAARNADWRSHFDLWSATVKTAPASARAHNNLGTAYLARAMPDQALVEFERALAIEPERADFLFNLALAYEHKGMIEQALQAYRRVLDVRPEFANVRNNIGLLYLRQGKLEEAVKALQEEIAMNPAAVQAHHSLGLIYDKQGRRDLAIEELRAAIRASPAYAEAHANLGYLYSKEGKLKEARAEFERALALQPDMAKVHSALGDVLVRMGELDLAIARYEKALEIDDQLAETHNNLGIAYGKKRRLEEAIEHYRRALQLNPNYLNIRLNLGATHELQGRPDLAIPQYVEILERAPGFVIVYAFLGRAYATMGRSEEAMHSYAMFLEKWQGDAKYAQVIRANMEKLREAEKGGSQ